MYYLVQKYGKDHDGYDIPINHSHLFTINTGKTLCGMESNGFFTRLTYADSKLKEWLIEKTTCKKCKLIAENLIKNKYYEEPC